ncbi:GNAT family N-acetyltransferase [Geodermatophilus nigrescens]|uniref:Acetyltransferase (GNAT) family protein n=1 Tax=Geodermatophilus nigrescens TaxID=1070870 RepID=A0A1M5E6V8_9ACTN|nr:GNAT family N-acetyltransferase [Geodermatophilus nigrescens]SHF74993.1 Acetyltransferase (GNAT) family protein [Geodermatophilus nigrescens]
MTVTVGQVGPDVVLPLRSVVLRDGGPAGLPGDDDPATVHLAARTADGRVAGVVRLSPAPCPWRPDARAPWQLRAMATDPAVRGTGAGRALVAAGLALVGDRGGDLVWCNARDRRGRLLRAAGVHRGHRGVRRAADRAARRHAHRGTGCDPLELMPGIRPARNASTNSRWSSCVCRA